MTDTHSGDPGAAPPASATLASASPSPASLAPDAAATPVPPAPASPAPDAATTPGPPAPAGATVPDPAAFPGIPDAAAIPVPPAETAATEPAEPGIHPFRIAFAPGVTVTKWTRLWAERRFDTPLEVFRAEPDAQVAVLWAAALADAAVSSTTVGASTPIPADAPTPAATSTPADAPTPADVSFVRLPIEQEGLSVISLYTEVQVVVVLKDHPASVFESVTVADLADEHLLQQPDDVPEWRDVALEIADGSRRPLLGIRNTDDAVEHVAAGVGILVLPQSIARLHNRKDIVYRPVTDVAETQIALAWVAANTTADIEEFVGIVRGRSAASSRADAEARASDEAAPDARPKKIGPVAKAKAKARAAAEAEAAAAKRAGVKKPATSSAPRKKKQSDAANAAQARRRKFGGKR